MSSWVAIPCLLSLQGEFDEMAPGRDKGAEGFVGDTSHSSSSDHAPDEDSDVLRSKDSDSKNEVHAYDCDSSGPWPDGKRGDIKGSWFDKKIHALVDRERERWRDPNDKCRLNYVIWFDQIADKDNDFQWVPYTGTSDPHTNHAHFSARYETECENDTSPWGVAEDGVSIKDLQDYFGYETGKKSTVDGCQESMIGNMAIAQRVPDVIGGGGKQVNFYKQVGQIASMVATIQASLGALPQEVINGVLAGLAEADGAAETIANAVVAALPPDMAQEVVAEMGRLLSGDAG